MKWQQLRWGRPEAVAFYNRNSLWDQPPGELYLPGTFFLCKTAFHISQLGADGLTDATTALPFTFEYLCRYHPDRPAVLVFSFLFQP